MEQQFTFAYGETQLPLTVRAGKIDVLEALTPPPITDLPEAFRAAVEEGAIGSPPLRNLLTPDDQVTIIISDLTRAWMHQERICPLLVDYLHDIIGLPYASMVFLVALGTHRPQTEAELRALTTDRVFDLTRVLNHEADKPLTDLGATSRGTPVQVSPWVIGRKVILVSGTVHHLLAGYGGGRKSILPGISGEATIQRNHLMALDPVHPRSSHLVGCGKLLNNPVHEDMVEAAAKVSPIFGINLLVDGTGAHIALPSGHWLKAWEESCRLVDRYNGVPIPSKADAVITSCGGYPKDINLYQSSKTMINAYQAVKEGGRLIFLSECREGGGPAAFFDWAKYQALGTLDAELRAHFTIAGYIYYFCCEIAAHTDMHMLTDIPADVLSPMRIHAHSVPDTLRPFLDFGTQHVIVMPHGSSTVPASAAGA